jgi:hypothetical protein
MVQTPGPGGFNAGFAQDTKIDDVHTTAPVGASEIGSKHDDLEQPTPRAVLNKSSCGGYPTAQPRGKVPRTMPRSN